MNSLDLDRAAETFAEATDFTVGVEEEFSILDPQTLELLPRFEQLRDAAAASDPLLHEHITGELISSEIEIISGAGADLHDALARQRERRRRLFALAARAGRRARRDRHAPVGRLPRAADHRHRALPPRRGRPEVRRLAQQHVQPARARRRPRHRPRGARLRPAAPGAAAAAGDLGQLALPRRARQRAALGAHAELHQELPALRRPRRVRRLAGLPRVHRVPRAHALDRRVHAGVVVGPPALQLRHRRGAHLRRAGDRAGVRRARLADGRVHRAGGARRRRGRAVRRSRAAADRGEHVARDPLRARRPADRPAERAEEYPAREAIERLLGVDGADARRARHRAGVPRAQRRPAPAPDDRGGRDARGGLRGVGRGDRDRPTPRR